MRPLGKNVLVKRAVMPKYAGTKITWNGADHVILAEDQLLAVDNDDEKKEE